MSRWREVAAVTIAGATMAAALPGVAGADEIHDRPRHTLDLQAHRGGLGLVVESTLPAFANALELGVTTLELDVQITEDGQAVVTHDRRISDKKCADTAPAFTGDPEFPYVGKYIHTLSLRQIRTMDCGTRTLAEFPGQRAVPGATMATLREVFDLVRRYRAHKVMLNVETKVEAGAPEQTAPREQFVQVTRQEIARAGMRRQVTIQSFDWGALMRMRELEPRLPIVALTNRDFLQTGQPGSSPWLGGIDIDDFGGDPLKAIKSFEADAFSPVHGFPQNGKITDPGYQPYVTKEMVGQAHSLGIKVIPWTIDDEPTLNKLIDDGVDGIITDYPDRLRKVMSERGFKLPKQYASKPGKGGHLGHEEVR
ncbi:glycerophosphodiester phosphodiesterase family protein [Nonomuraea sp. LPB2021202275-12-8]|uniref:glycerophosphodiester phosphodiesterase family protein n=1 Tax=Nonomuraea sp. LPB2021202275-12-8 TaxID=3120159 RepID=UPI00300D9E1E